MNIISPVLIQLQFRSSTYAQRLSHQRSIRHTTTSMTVQKTQERECRSCVSLPKFWRQRLSVFAEAELSPLCIAMVILAPAVSQLRFRHSRLSVGPRPKVEVVVDVNRSASGHFESASATTNHIRSWMEPRKSTCTGCRGH